MALSRAESVAKSDAKRGYKAKTYKLPVETVLRIEQLAAERKLTQAEVIKQAIALFESQVR